MQIRIHFIRQHVKSSEEALCVIHNMKTTIGAHMLPLTLIVTVPWRYLIDFYYVARAPLISFCVEIATTTAISARQCPLVHKHFPPSTIVSWRLHLGDDDDIRKMLGLDGEQETRLDLMSMSSFLLVLQLSDTLYSETVCQQPQILCRSWRFVTDVCHRRFS